MLISASIKNSRAQNYISVATNSNIKTLAIPAKSEGQGSSVNGGELLFLALATCFCNNVYREAARWQLQITSVDVTVSGTFGAEGEPASGIHYEVNIQSPEPDAEIAALVQHVDQIAEVHNTLRQGARVTLKQ